jgi:hypothetical protein
MVWVARLKQRKDGAGRPPEAGQSVGGHKLHRTNTTVPFRSLQTTRPRHRANHPIATGNLPLNYFCHHIRRAGPADVRLATGISGLRLPGVGYSK